MLSNKNSTQKSPKLSVVVIAYNNELYIEEALESLNEQTLEDLEIVVVNDFSSDRTGELIDRFIEGKPKFKAIHLQQNSGGCSTPRNTGIKNTTGEYIMFLDGDDWYTIDACEKMVAGIERTNSDFVAGQVIRTNNYEIWYDTQIYSVERTNINVREFSTLLFDSLSVNKIYKRSFLEKHNLLFPEGIHYEDIVFTGKAYFLADSISIIPEPVYYWRVVENTNVKSITNRRFEFDNFKNRITAHRLFDQFLQEHGDTLYQVYKNNKFLRHDLKLYTNDYLLFDDEYKAQFHNLIHEYLHEVMDKYAFINLPERERILYYLLYIGDKEAFSDYVKYINGMSPSIDRVYAVGNSYYFKTSKTDQNHQKFLYIKELMIHFNIKDIELKNESFSFRSEVHVESLANSEITYFWRLKNKQTGATMYSKFSDDNHVNFSLEEMSPGNYYLSLFVSHQGNLHKRLVRNSDIECLPNIKVEDRLLSKKIFINSKNSFAISVRPLKKKDQIKWIFQKRKKIDQDEEQSAIRNALANYVKNIFKKMSIRSNWVLFESHMGKQYSDSPKYIYETMYKKHANYKFIWSFEDPETISLPGPAIKVKRKSLKHYYYLVRSKFWVDNQGMAHLAKKKKQQVYLQTWHGTPLKKMGVDQKKLPSDDELSKLKLQTNAWDYFISPNSYSTAIFRKAFRYGGEIIESGYPRNDLLMNQPEEIVQKTKQHFGISPGKRIILFAPTFRDWDTNSFQETLRDIHSLSKAIDENTIVLLRLHYLLSKGLLHQDLPPNVIDASTYQDIQELYLIADVLVTDYSSVMFDFALLKRPIILYCYDLEEYISRRGTYFDLVKEGPGPVCYSIDAVISYLENPAALSNYKQALEQFSSKFGDLENGQAAQKVIDRVFN